MLLGDRCCPVCDRRDWEHVLDAAEMFGGERFAIARCPCGLLATDDRLDEEARARFYHYEGGADAGVRFRALVEPLMRALRRRRVGTLTRLKGRPGKVLDVGCGRGVMLDALAEAGWDVYGTELDEAVAATARGTLGDHVRVGAIEQVELPEAPFDLVTFWHVLEHLPDPRQALDRAREVLAGDGAVVVAMPNIDSLQAKLTGRHWLHLDVPRHRWHFSPKTLVALASRAGLRHLQTEQLSLEYGPYGLFQSVLAMSGLGHDLFTRILRPAGNTAFWRQPALYKHLLLSGPLLAAAAASVPLEALAALLGRGGAVVVIMVARDQKRSSIRPAHAVRYRLQSRRA